MAALPLALPAAANAVVDPTVPAARDTEPVILTGQDFGHWSVPANQTARLPLLDLTECQSFDEECSHNQFAEPQADTRDALGRGVPVDQLVGFRWVDKKTNSRFKQIPFQVDEQFTRY